MKRIIIPLLLLILCVSANAQYGSYNSVDRTMFVFWQRGTDGYFHRFENVRPLSIDYIVEDYALDKKTKNLYVMTVNSNAVVTLDKETFKRIKKAGRVPQMKGQQLANAIAAHTERLDSMFTLLNAKWRQHVEDSISQARADSIERVREHERQLAAQRKAAAIYRRSHNWHMVPTSGVGLYCTDCEKSFYNDSTFCVQKNDDLLYFVTPISGDLGINYLKVHVAEIPEELREKHDFNYHCDIFRDSLTNDTLDYGDIMEDVNNSFLAEYVRKLCRKAPYGFFDSWGWDDEYSMVTFNFRYTNLNPKTIRYITVYFRITNDVGDLRCSGYFRGTGPLKQFESASWDWDSSSYFVSGDASNMNITKVVLTWMNGKQQVISSRYLQFNDDDD